ncbi:MAG: hypothetical protein ACI4CS_03065 [Candidatus Weimeria sp.]
MIDEVVNLGFPESLGVAIAKNLNSVRTMQRMTGYLRNVRPDSDILIVDEMLAIMDDRNRWIEKKKSEEANARYNEFLEEQKRADQPGTSGGCCSD